MAQDEAVYLRDMPLADVLVRYPAVQRELGAHLEKDEHKLSHPITKKLAARQDLSWFLGKLEDLLVRARAAQAFAKLVGKLRRAKDDAAFLDAIAELTVCARLIDA